MWILKKLIQYFKQKIMDFPGAHMVKASAYNAGDLGSILWETFLDEKKRELVDGVSVNWQGNTKNNR